MEPIVSLIYCSEATDQLKQGQEMVTLLSTAQQINQKNGVTGVICFNSIYIMQLLEGGRSAVNETYQRILQDSRHQQVTLLDYRQLSKRSFREWAMGFIPTEKIGENINRMYTPGDEFNPYEFNSESSYLFAMEVGKLAQNTVE